MSFQTKKQRENDKKIKKMLYDILKEQGMLKSYEKFPDIVKRPNPMEYYNKFEQVPLDKRDEAYRKDLFKILRKQANLKKKYGRGLLCGDDEFIDDDYMGEIECMTNGGRKKRGYTNKSKNKILIDAIKEMDLNPNTMTKAQFNKLLKKIDNKNKKKGYGEYMDNRLYGSQDIDDYLRKKAFQELKKKERRSEGGRKGSKKNKWVYFVKKFHKQNPELYGTKLFKKAKVEYDILKRKGLI